MLKTKPILNMQGTGCSRLFVRFKSQKLPSIYHHVGDSLGAALMIVGMNPDANLIDIQYVNPMGILLKTVSYAREDILEFTLEESVCEVDGAE